MSINMSHEWWDFQWTQNKQQKELFVSLYTQPKGNCINILRNLHKRSITSLIQEYCRFLRYPNFFFSITSKGLNSFRSSLSKPVYSKLNIYICIYLYLNIYIYIYLYIDCCATLKAQKFWMKWWASVNSCKVQKTVQSASEFT